MKRKMIEIKIDKSKYLNFSKLQNIKALVQEKYKGIVMEEKKGKITKEKRKKTIKSKGDKVGEVQDVGIHNKKYIRYYLLSLYTFLENKSLLTFHSTWYNFFSFL